MKWWDSLCWSEFKNKHNSSRKQPVSANFNFGIERFYHKIYARKLISQVKLEKRRKNVTIIRISWLLSFGCGSSRIALVVPHLRVGFELRREKCWARKLAVHFRWHTSTWWGPRWSHESRNVAHSFSAVIHKAKAKQTDPQNRPVQHSAHGRHN